MKISCMSVLTHFLKQQPDQAFQNFDQRRQFDDRGVVYGRFREIDAMRDIL